MSWGLCTSFLQCPTWSIVRTAPDTGDSLYHYWKHLLSESEGLQRTQPGSQQITKLVSGSCSINSCRWWMSEKEGNLMSVPKGPLNQNSQKLSWWGVVWTTVVIQYKKILLLYFCTEISCLIGWIKIITSADFTYFSYIYTSIY